MFASNASPVNGHQPDPVVNRDDFVSAGAEWKTRATARPTVFSPFKKSSLENYLKELKELKNEKLFLRNELDLLQQEFFAEVCPTLVPD